MKSINQVLDFKKTDPTALKRSFMEACSDPVFRCYIETLPIEEELLIQYTSTLQDACSESEHCKNCSGLLECKNKMCGYVLTPTRQERSIGFSYDACPYQQTYLKQTQYQKYMTVYDEPKEIKNASLNQLYKDDKNRIPIIKYFKEFLDHYEEAEKPKGIYLHGSFGSGKSYLIAALFNELAKRNINSAIVYFPEFLRNLKSSFHEDYEERFRYIKSVPLLLLDDIGAENITPWARDEVLGPILQYRMDQHLPTFFTSNLTLEELATHLSNTSGGVDQVKARRIVERIRQLSNDFELVSKNRRG